MGVVLTLLLLVLLPLVGSFYIGAAMGSNSWTPWRGRNL